MSLSPQQIEELHDLLWGLRAGSATPSELHRLEQCVCEDVEAREFYVHYMQLCADLSWGGREREEISADASEYASTRQQAANEPNDDSLQCDPFSTHDTTLSKSSAAPRIAIVVTPTPAVYSSLALGTFLFSYAMAFVITGIAMLAASLITMPDYRDVAMRVSPSAVHSADSRFAAQSDGPSDSHSATPARKIVGHVTGMVNCRWTDVNAKASVGQRVAVGQTVAVASGLVEITYDTGAKVLLQGPVTYQVDSPRSGLLSVGKLTARVEKKETRDQKSNPQPQIPNPALFAIRTPTAVVTDLGTEFGVEVKDNGETRSHVFRGSIRVEPLVVEGQSNANATKVLHADESARVLHDGDHVRITVSVASDKAFSSSNFVRDIRVVMAIKTLDLADVIAGGNGFSHRCGRGIDQATGRPIEQPWPNPKDGKFPLGDHTYHLVKELPFVDGVFIPDGSSGPVQVDSAGHVFEAFEATCNKSPGYVWSGADPYKGQIPNFVRSELEGIEYSSPGHSVLLMHANKGVTFDLEAIRRENSGQKLLRFRATAGNTELASSQESYPTTADFWVLVDGGVRYRRHGINGCTGAFPVMVPIGDKDRFLTLASTDGGDGIYWDWIIFGDPHLEMAPVAENPDVPLQKLSTKN
jgi:hypothetical protein